MLDVLHQAFLSFLVMVGLAQPGPVTYQGYGEGEYVLVAPQIAGNLETLNVARGQQVHKGEALFALDHADETAALDQAKAQAEHAEATLADLLKGKRAPEIETLTAQRDQARAALEIAKITFDRDQKQLKAEAISRATLDNDKSALDQAQAHLAGTEADLATGLLSTGRDDAIKAAAADVAAAQATVTSAQWRLDQKSAAAPGDAFVFDTLYRPGEFIAAGQAVVSLLPALNIRARFFVPEPDLASLPAGTAVQIHCDGCAELIPAHVTYVAPQAEYSPPQLYNRNNRERLLYMLEATPDSSPELIHPGQPVDVTVGDGT
ncbi:MAG: HlyD family efflux transporter periplasmic adaptor subunit [Alphaproteobacteria bacterium]|nr:HlyD family efflux transporter periplasmic adaptor subunit [Alphaproteobacteria bacterium]